MGVTCLMVVLLAQAAPEPRSIAPREVEDGLTAAVKETTVPASVDLRSELGKRFRLVEARLVMDGQELSHRLAATGQELEMRTRLYDGAVRPGRHAVQVTLVYEGRNKGPFTYLDDYKVRLESTVDFNFAEGSRPGALEILAYERPGATVTVEHKPMMEIKSAANSGATAAVQVPAPRQR